MFTRSQYEAIAKAIACSRQLAVTNPELDPLDIVADTFADIYETRDRFGPYSEFMTQTNESYEVCACNDSGALEFRLKGTGDDYGFDA